MSVTHLTLKLRASYLDKVGGVSVIINAACVEARPSALGAQTRNQTECCNGRSAVGRGRRERDREYADITLDSKDLSSHGENRPSKTGRKRKEKVAHDKLTPV
jgi:hypothetical protein